jgi:hypothetical protein
MTSKIDGSANICHLQDLPVVAQEFGGVEMNGPDAREVHISGQGQVHPRLLKAQVSFTL